MRALWTAATGMMAQQTNVDVISNNLANVNTTGFKKSRANFQDLLYSTLKTPGVQMGGGMELPVGIQIGSGVRTESVSKVFTQGDFASTENPYDLVIEGDGFFQVMQPNGETGYTRGGSFKVDSQGRLCTGEGYTMTPAITIPQDATEVSVGADGTVSASYPNQAAATVVGNITIAKFSNPSGLLAAGHGIYKESSASGAPQVGAPGENGSGTIMQGFLEMSNVKVVEEMINMITGQRAYEINAKAVTTSDEMLSTANRLKA